MFDLIVEFVDCNDQFRIAVFDLFGKLWFCVLWVGCGGDGTNSHCREESNWEMYGVWRQDENGIIFGDVKVEEGAGEP